MFFDRWLIVTCCLLVVGGLFLVASASHYAAMSRGLFLDMHRAARNGDGAQVAQLGRMVPYSAISSPDPPNSAGKSLNFGSPSRIGRTVST
jgi:hypothetical protein